MYNENLGTTEPMWNQTFAYAGLRRSDLRLRALEITVWDYVRYGANDFLGEAIVELWPLDEQPTWRTLGPHEEVALTPSEHLSPPSTGSRFSDSDTPSECEIDGNRERRGADGASVSSVGSSTSPPRDTDRRSRRDQEVAYNPGYRRVSRTPIKYLHTILTAITAKVKKLHFSSPLLSFYLRSEAVSKITIVHYKDE